MSTPSRRSALIVASSHYSDPRLRRLRAPAHDAELLAEVLRDPEVGAFEVAVSVDEPESAVRRKLALFFDDRGRDDLLLAHFSCHGLKDEDGSLYFAAPDTDLDHLDATAVSAEFVNRLMNRSLSRRIVLLLDCCYAGAFGKGAVSRAGTGVELKERFDGRGRVVITASNSMEYAFEGDELTGEGRPSIFTSAIVGGLGSGDADRDGDGLISVDDLYEHIYEEVREQTPNQTPSKWTFDVQGDLVVARSRAGPVERPARPVPATAAAAVARAAPERATLYWATAQKMFRALGHLRYSVVFATIALVLFNLTPDDSRPARLEEPWQGSPLNRDGTLAIGAILALAACLAAIRPALRQGAAAFVVALGLLELCGAIATVALRRTDLSPGEPGYGVPLGWNTEIAAGLSMAAAGVAAALTLRGRQRPPSLRPSIVAAIVTLLATLTIFWSLKIPQYADEAGNRIRLGYVANAYHIEPVAIGLAALIGIWVALRSAYPVAAGWLAAIAVNLVLYAAGLALAVTDFATPPNQEGLTVYWGCAFLFVATVLLGVASGLLVRAAHRQEPLPHGT